MAGSYKNIVPALQGKVDTTSPVTNDALGELINRSQNKSNFFSQTLKDRQKAADETLDNEEGLFCFGENNDPDQQAASYVLQAFKLAQQHRIQTGIDAKLEMNYRVFNQEYTPEESASIAAQGEVDVYYPLGWRMCNTMVSFLRKTLSGGDIDHPQFDIEPTTIPDPPPELVARAQGALARRVSVELSLGVRLTEQDVQKMLDSLGRQLYEESRDRSVRAVRRAKLEVDDRLQEGNWGQMFDNMLNYLARYGTAIVEGPSQRIKKRQYFTRSSIKTRKEYYAHFEALDPFRFYFSADSCTTQDGSYVIYIERANRKELMEMRHQDGYFADAIDVVLSEFATQPRNWCNAVDGPGSSIRAADEKERVGDMGSSVGNWGFTEQIDVLRYTGCMPGALLRNMGITSFDGRDVEPHESYEVELKQVGKTPIFVRCNVDPLCERPFTSAQLFDRPGTPWGYGVIDPIEDIQRMINQMYRAQAVNSAYASAPISEVDDALLSTHNQDHEVTPGATFVKNSADTGLSGQALHVHQINSRISEFQAGIDGLIEHAEMILGLPRFLLGQHTGGGAARTLGGLQSLTSNAYVQLRSVIVNIDNGITRPVITRLHRWIVNRTDNNSILGDVTVVTKGANALLGRAVNQDRLQALLGTFLPLAQAGLVTQVGVTDILKQLAESHGLDPERVVVDPEQDAIDNAYIQQQLQSIGGFSGGQAAAASPNGGTLGLAGGAGAALADPSQATGQAVGLGAGGLVGSGSVLDPSVQFQQRTNIRR